MKGIYKFTNKINGKSYIGQSVQLETRYNSHKRNYNNSNLSVYNSKFYRAIRKYGFENFDYEILIQSDNFTTDDLNQQEQYYIKKYDSYKNGYNMNYGGNQTGSNYFINEQTILKIKDMLKNNINISMSEIARCFNLSSPTIVLSINRGQTYAFIGNYTYPIRIKEEIRKIAQGDNNSRALMTNEEVLSIRKSYVTQSLTEIYEKYKDRISFSGLKKIVYGIHFQNLPIYKKRKKQQYLNNICIDYPC